MGATLLSLQLRPVQQFLSQRITAYLSQELQAHVSVSSFYLKPFSSVVIEEFYLEDQRKDTLFYAEKLSAGLDLQSLFDSQITFNSIKLENGKFHLKRREDSTSNMRFLFDYFKSDRKKEKKGRMRILFPDVELVNMDLRYKDFTKTLSAEGINFADVHLKALNGDIRGIDVENYLFKADIQHLSFFEKSGLQVKDLKAVALIESQQMEFSNLDLQLNGSRIREYVRFNYDSFEDFSSFITKVHVQSHLTNARILSKDIAFFAPDIQVTSFDVSMTGDLSGTVDQIEGKDVEIRTGRETWLAGNLSIRGLPKIESTLFEMDLNRLRSTRSDLEVLIQELSHHEHFVLPDVFNRFGKIDYQGRVTGLYNHFLAQGTFTTDLGTLIADVNLDIRNQGEYHGTVFSPVFELGTFLQMPEVGQASFRADIEGKGLSIDGLEEKVNGNLVFIDYKGYRYQHIHMDGVYQNEIFNGDIQVRDENLDVDFTGKLDLSRTDLKYDFVADAKYINLQKLNFLSDAVSLAGHFEADFTGNSLSTLDGRFLVKELQLNRGAEGTKVDSLLLFTTLEDSIRVLAVESGIADAKINGSFQLSSLPAYFQSLTKQYIPSLRTKEVKFEQQEFDFELHLKDFRPIALLFAPEVSIPELVFARGKFSSVHNTATLSGYIPKIGYKKIEVSDLIFDQTTGLDALNLFVTADRVHFTDSLYVENVNLATVLRHDSLNFNMKLSDLSAKNQLDLNGLVEFSAGDAVHLSLLPSFLMINRDEWSLQEKVSIAFLPGGRMQVRDLELLQGNQKVVVSGLISDKQEDQLDILFEGFQLSTLNSLASLYGVELKGKMDGSISINSLLASPYFFSNLHAREIIYNQIRVGNLEARAGWNKDAKEVDLSMNIRDGNRETLSLAGTYNPARPENALFMQAKLQEGELALFQPFLRNLISDLSGTASGEVNVRGSLTDPKFNGNIALKNASFIVNYLKTPYLINHTVAVENSKIFLNDLVIEDPYKNKAIANGYVDLANPRIPNIQASVDATRFLVLNTTFKDNPLYYGTAFGTGNFSFQGPTDDMTIRIAAATNQGTVISLPLNTSETIEDRDFISFVSKDSVTFVPPKNVFQGLNMNMDLTVGNESRAIIFTDLGKMSGNGEGLLSMRISSLGDFEMFGDYTIASGEFEFTAQDFINKKFEINRGGSIRWTGNPKEALINLVSVYEVRTSVRPLYIAAGRGEGSEQRVTAQAEMMLNGNLLHPDISFEINFPSDSYIREELQSYFSDANNVNQQALSLIVRRSFAPGTGTDLTRELNTTVLSAGTELAFNQLNNIISQSLNLNFVDFNIRSFNEASASIRLLSNRLVLTGGVTDRRGQLNDFNVFGKEVVSDIEAIYLLRSSGNLLLRASNRLNNRNILNPTDEYVSAIGLIYRQDFDTFNEFFRRMLFFGSSQRKSKEQKPGEEKK